MIYQLDAYTYLSKPCQPPGIEVIRNSTAEVPEGFHLCDREPGKTGEAEILTMGRIHWCYTRALYWCEFCKADVNFDLAWKMNIATPEDLEDDYVELDEDED
jgi:hypothetical protein